MKKLFLILLLFTCGCKTDWFEKGTDFETQGNYAKALESFKKGADRGNSLCMWQIARYYQFGLGEVPCDEEKAFQWYQKSAKAGCISCYINVGNAYLNGRGVNKDPNMAIVNFKKANAKGDPQGLFELGKMYYEGIGVTKDYQKAFQDFQNAASLDCYDAISQLAVMYAKGLYVKQDTEKAEGLFLQLVETSKVDKKYIRKGLSRNLCEIGIAFLQGEDAPRDEKLAFHWLSMANEWGNEEAIVTLAFMYGYGVGVDKDLTEAEKLLTNRINESGVYEVFYPCYELGKLYLQAYDPPEYEKALKCFVLVAEDVNAPLYIAAASMNQISVLYLSDAGIEYNAEKGKEWFDKAVAKYEELTEYSPKAMWELGQLYEAPYKETKNMEKAIYWYQQAADEGWEEAKTKLEELKKSDSTLQE